MDPYINRRFLTGAALKRIAAASMVIDHFAIAVFYRVIYVHAVQTGSDAAHTLYMIHKVMRGCGRLAFPLFAFLLVEGFTHTKDVRKYALRLFLFALLSEIPFDLCIYGQFWHPEKQNVFFTLLIGLGTLFVTHRIRIREMKNELLRVFLMILAAGAGACLAYFLKTDYQWYGVLLIVIFYHTRALPPGYKLLGAAALCWRSFEWPSAAAFLMLPFYSGEKGRQKKYFFYLLYPAHLMVFYIVSRLLLRIL